MALCPFTLQRYKKNHKPQNIIEKSEKESKSEKVKVKK